GNEGADFPHEDVAFGYGLGFGRAHGHALRHADADDDLLNAGIAGVADGDGVIGGPAQFDDRRADPLKADRPFLAAGWVAFFLARSQLLLFGTSGSDRHALGIFHAHGVVTRIGARTHRLHLLLHLHWIHGRRRLDRVLHRRRIRRRINENRRRGL